MAVIDDGDPGLLGVHEIKGALALSDEARWNQTADDWQFFCTHGRVFALRAASRLIATAALLPHGTLAGRPGLAWISMVLVTATKRRLGLATALLRTCVEAATQQDLTVWLDATPTGTAVYTPLGFRPATEIVRLRRPRPSGSSPDPTAPRGAEQREQLLALDRRAMAADRSALFGDILQRPGTVLHASPGGACLVREGRCARHIGPLYAEEEATAAALIEAAVEAETGPLVIDVRADRAGLKALLSAHGFFEERPFCRMVRGNGTLGDDAIAYASAGPEFG